jgi:hypothetical protein
MTDDGTRQALRQGVFQQATGLSKDQIGNMIKRGTLPFHDPENVGWSTYTYPQAYATVLADALVKAHPDSKAVKSHIEMCFDRFIVLAKADLLADKDVFFGIGAGTFPSLISPTGSMGPIFWIGPVVEIEGDKKILVIEGDAGIRAISDDVFKDGIGFVSAAAHGLKFSSLTMINANHALRFNNPMISSGTPSLLRSWLERVEEK